MSWQAYVDSSLVGTGDVDKAAIFSSDGTGCWAKSSDFTPTAGELKEVVNGYKDSSKLFGSGFHIAGVKYMTIKADGDSIYGKQGKAGVIIVRTKQALLVAHHSEDVASTNAATTVEKLGDYLRGLGY